MSDCEKRLAKTWYNDDDIAVEEIARRLRRNPSSIWESLGIDETATRGVGRKAALSEKDKDRLVKLTEKMVKKANVRYMVTQKMIDKYYKVDKKLSLTYLLFSHMHKFIHSRYHSFDHTMHILKQLFGHVLVHA